VLLHAQLRSKHDPQITDDRRWLDDIRSDGNGAVDIDELNIAGLFAKPGKFSFGIIQLQMAR